MAPGPRSHSGMSGYLPSVVLSPEVRETLRQSEGLAMQESLHWLCSADNRHGEPG